MKKLNVSDAAAQSFIESVVRTWANRRLRYSRPALSQEALAEAAGIHPMSVSRYERLAKAGKLSCIHFNHFLRVEAVLAGAGAGIPSTRSLVSGFRTFTKSLKE